ncbi:monoacylglycerol lipase ABHD6-like [Glandiceps talaboti]
MHVDMLPSVVLAVQCAIIFGGAFAATVVLLVQLKPGWLYNLYTRFRLYIAGMSINYIKAGEYTYCYADRGRGKSTKPPLLFLHGFSTSKDMWANIVKRLPKDLHIVLVDMPGHGDTTQKLKTDHSYVAQANKIHQFVEAYGLNKSRFHLIGASMGGAVAGTYASLFAKELVKLTLMCPAGMITPKDSPYYEGLKSGKSNVLVARNGEELKATLKACLYSELKLPNWVFNMVFQAREQHREFFQHLMTELLNHKEGLQERLPDIKTPTQVIWGQNDQIIDVSGVDVIKKELKTLERVDILEECGHNISMEKPAKAAQALRVFMD